MPTNTLTFAARPFDKYDRKAESLAPAHGIKTPENEDTLQRIRDADRITIGASRRGDIATKSELFQNIGNSIILLKEAYKNTPDGFNANKLLYPIAKDQVNQDDGLTHTRRWIDSPKCSLNNQAKKDVLSILNGCKNAYDDGKSTLQAENPREYLKRQDVNGLNRLVETKMSKATLYASPEINKIQQQICNSIRKQWSPKEWDRLIDLWLQKRPSEFPVGRLQTHLQKGDKKTPANSASARFDKAGQFDVAQFISFHRFLSKHLSKDVTEAQKASYHSIKEHRGEVPAVETPSGRKDAHKIGITLRNVSTESLRDLTDVHTRPIDYKRADPTRPIHNVGMDLGYPLACGLSGTTNVHLFGLYQGHADSMNHYERTGEDRGVMTEASLRGFIEMLASTLCLDGGHSRFELYAGAMTTLQAMRNMDPPLEHQEFIDNLAKVVEPFVNGLKLYDNHYKLLIDDEMMDKAQLHDAFTDSLVHLRNGKDVAQKNTLHLHYDDMHKKLKQKEAKKDDHKTATAAPKKPVKKTKIASAPDNKHTVKPPKEDWITKLAKYLLT